MGLESSTCKAVDCRLLLLRRLNAGTIFFPLEYVRRQLELFTKIFLDLHIGLCRDADGNARNKLHLETPQGNDISCVYQISPVYRVKIRRKHPGQFADGVAAGNPPVGTYQFRAFALAFYIHHRSRGNIESLPAAFYRDLFFVVVFQKQIFDKLRGVKIHVQGTNFVTGVIWDKFMGMVLVDDFQVFAHASEHQGEKGGCLIETVRAAQNKLAAHSCPIAA